MSKEEKNKEEISKLSCYLDKESLEKAKKRASDIGLSLSAYIRFLIKKDLAN